MSQFVILHKRDECIGCGLCAEHAPDYWSMNDEGVAELNEVLRQEGPFDCTQADANHGFRLLAISRACPVNVIRVR